MAADTRPPARTAAKNESAPPRVQSAPPISANAPKRCTAPAVPGKYSKRPSEPFRKVFYIPLSLVISFRLLGAAVAAVMVIALLGGATRLAGHRLDAVHRQIQRTRCNQVVKETLHHDLSRSFLCNIVETVFRSLLLSYTEHAIKTSGSFYEYCIMNSQLFCA